MTELQKQTTRLIELQRVRANSLAGGHPDDVCASMALALKYISGTTHYRAALSSIAEGLDTMIEDAKDKVRSALE